MSSNYDSQAFHSISTFVKDLSEIFAAKHHSLALYCRLINKTTVQHTTAIEKHIQTFRNFCVKNRSAILEKDVSKIVEPRVSYSEKVFIDISSILISADIETNEIIWKHILTISAFLDPTAKAKEILKKNMTNSAKEVNLINDIMNKVEENYDHSSTNPMEAVTSILKSGVFNDIMSNIGGNLQNGELDLGKLVGTMQQVVVSILPQVNGGGGVSELHNGIPMNNNTQPQLDLSVLFSTFAATMKHTENPPNLPDLSTILQTLGSNPDMEKLNEILKPLSTQPIVEEVTDEK